MQLPLENLIIHPCKPAGLCNDTSTVAGSYCVLLIPSFIQAAFPLCLHSYYYIIFPPCIDNYVISLSGIHDAVASIVV